MLRRRSASSTAACRTATRGIRSRRASLPSTRCMWAMWPTSPSSPLADLLARRWWRGCSWCSAGGCSAAQPVQRAAVLFLLLGDPGNPAARRHVRARPVRNVHRAGRHGGDCCRLAAARRAWDVLIAGRCNLRSRVLAEVQRRRLRAAHRLGAGRSPPGLRTYSGRLRDPCMDRPRGGAAVLVALGLLYFASARRAHDLWLATWPTTSRIPARRTAASGTLVDYVITLPCRPRQSRRLWFLGGAGCARLAFAGQTLARARDGRPRLAGSPVSCRLRSMARADCRSISCKPQPALALQLRPG